MSQSEKFVFIVPEYNGSFPGVLKTFIDGLAFPDTFEQKKNVLWLVFQVEFKVEAWHLAT